MWPIATDSHVAWSACLSVSVCVSCEKMAELIELLFVGLTLVKIPHAK